MTETSSEAAILGAIMSAAVDAIIVSDAEGTILRANPAANRLFGYSVGELMGENVTILMPAGMAARHDRFMTNYLETGDAKIIGSGRQVEGKRKGGDRFPVHLSVGEAKVEGRRIFVAILHDMTHRVASENALARSQRLDAIGQMTGGISHDFNNLLTVIIGNLELAEMQCHDAVPAELLRNALEAAEMGASLTSRLMIFARKGDLKPETTDLRQVCAKALRMLGNAFGETYRVSADFPDDLMPIYVDPVQLQSALVNLAINARDAMPSGGNLLFSIREITVDDEYMAQETDVERGNYVRLLISDDGEGMAPEAQRRAFEPFFTTKADRSGTGLGLAMVYGFIRQSGGHITLYSELGKGTSIGLYFPVMAEGEKGAAPQQEGTDQREQPMGAGQCVLVVEDNAKVRRISVDRLHALNYRTMEAESGDEAYRLMKNGAKVDLVFSDLVMPGSLSGYDLASRLAAEFPTVKVLLTSGYASDVVARKDVPPNGVTVLHKPYHQRDLAYWLHALLEGVAD